MFRTFRALKVLFSVIVVCLTLASVAQAACTYMLVPVSRSFPVAGGSAAIAVDTASGCTWTATSGAPWITILSGASGSGVDVVYYAVSYNSGASRTGVVTVAGQTHTVTQAGAGAACTYNVSPATASIAAAGGNGTVLVTAGSGCSWTASSNANWITISAGAAGSGNGTVQYSAAVNTTVSARSGTLTIAGQTFSLSQAAAGTAGAPSIASGGVVNAADYTANFAPGGIISIFGANLARSLQQAGAPPLPTALDGTFVEAVIGESTVRLPLFLVSPGQVNAQLPYGITQDLVGIRVRTATGLSDTEMIRVAPANPRLFTVPSGGSGPAALLHGNYQRVTAAAPALPGEWLVVYLTGFGEVTPAVAAGRAGGDGGANSPFNRVKESVTVTVAGRAVEVYFAGLAPGFSGLYQVNFRVPEDLLPCVPEIVVQAAGRYSQSLVTFPISLNWSAATVKPVGPGGGSVSAGPMVVTVPAGALNSTVNLSVRQSLDANANDPKAISPVFKLEGLPATSTMASVSIQTAGNPPPAQGTYLVVHRSDGSQVFVKATVQGNRVTAPLPPQPTGTITARGAARAAEAEDSTDLLLYLLADILKVSSPKGYFDAIINEPWDRFTTPDEHDANLARDTQVLAWLDADLDELFAMGFDASVPISVVFAPRRREQREYFGQTGDTVVYREDGGQISWSPRKVIEIDTGYFRKPPEEEAPAGYSWMRAKAGHLLFHLVQKLYDASGRNSMAAAKQVHPWEWWDEANAIVFERRLAGRGAYTPLDLPSDLRRLNDGKVLAGGLDGPLAETIDRSVHSGYPRGGVLASFLEFLVVQVGDRPWISNTYKDLNFQTASFKASSALVRAQGETSLSEKWLAYARSVGNGYFLAGRPLERRVEAMGMPKYEGIPLREDSVVTQSWSAPDFSVRYFLVMAADSGIPAGSRLKVTASGATLFVRKAIWNNSLYFDDEIGVSGLTSEISDFGKVEDYFLVGLANGHVDSRQPHADNASVKFEVIPPSGCPAPGKARGAGVTSCGVSGGLDETSRKAWTDLLVTKGLTATFDGGVISLTINADGTGTISPSVRYRATYTNRAGDSFDGTIDYRLALTSCATNMYSCKGTYRAVSTETYNGATKTYPEGTGSWTVDRQSDGTYLLKIPNGHPPTWGDIPYRLK